jgi:PAS domain S-box-containing protein
MEGISCHFRVSFQWGVVLVALILCQSTALAQEQAFGRASDDSFAPEERAWLERHPVLRFSADPAWPPFSFAREAGIEGVDADYLALVSGRLGVKLEYVPSGNWQETMEMLKGKEIDFAPGIARIEGRNLNTLYTEPYVSLPVAVILREDRPFFTSLAQMQRDSLVVAGPAEYAPTLFLKQNYPEIPLVTTKTSLDAMRMVAEGKADAVIENLGVAAHLIKTNGLANLKIGGLTNERFDLHLAVREDAPELQSILNKVLATITEEERLRIYDKWILVDFSRVTMWSQIWKFCLIGLVFALSIIGIILVWNRRLARELALRRDAENSLRKSESTFRNLFETMQDAYFLTRPGGEIQLVNEEAVRMLQIGSRRFVERLNIATFFEQPGERDRVMEQLNIRGSLRDYPLEFARADGSLCACQCNIQILRDTTGEQIAIEYIARWDPREATVNKTPSEGGIAGPPPS